MKLKDLAATAVAILIFAFVNGFFIYIQFQYWEASEKECDNTFGKDKWNMVDVTAGGKCGISQCWRCLPNTTVSGTP